MIKYHISNLTCNNCGIKIEDAIKRLDGVNDVSLNIISETILVDASLSEAELLEKVQLIASDIEPDVTVSLEKDQHEDHDHDHEERPLWFDLAISLILFVLGLANVLGLHDLFLIAAYVLSGHRVVMKAIKNIMRLDFFDENFLMTIATFGALYIGEIAEAAAVMIFYLVGETLQHQAVHNSKQSILNLLDNSISAVSVLNREELVDPRFVKVNEIVRVVSGEKIQLDGIVVSGESYLDTKSLTGESVYRKVGVNDEVLASMINHEGTLDIKVTKLYNESVMAKMIETLENAPSKKAHTEKLITRFSRIYTPIVVVLAIIIAFLFPLIFTSISRQTWLYRALIFLVASCPCALVVSVPLSYFAGLGKASREHILVKAASHFEEALKIENIYLDKTGTITKGNFKVVNVTHPDALYYAALLEQYSKHPIASSILSANSRELTDTITRFREISGQGLAGKLDGQTIYVGNQKLMENQNIEIIENKSNGTIVYVAIEKLFIGSIVIMDEVKASSQKAIEHLKAKGYNFAILSGDNQQFVTEISQEVKIDKAYWELYPQDKLKIVEEDFSKTMVVGDGINDALVLKAADLGVAMGQLGSDLAIETADIVLGNDDLSQLDTFFNIARKTQNIVIQNIVFALGVKIFVLILGTLGLTNMIVAVFSDVGVTVLAVLNALRIMR